MTIQCIEYMLNGFITIPFAVYKTEFELNFKDRTKFQIHVHQNTQRKIFRNKNGAQLTKNEGKEIKKHVKQNR